MFPPHGRPARDKKLEIEITPEMVEAGKQAVRAAWDDGDYLDEEAVRVFIAMLAACDDSEVTVSISDSVRYVSQ